MKERAGEGGYAACLPQGHDREPDSAATRGDATFSGSVLREITPAVLCQSMNISLSSSVDLLEVLRLMSLEVLSHPVPLT